MRLFYGPFPHLETGPAPTCITRWYNSLCTSYKFSLAFSEDRRTLSKTIAR